MPDSELLPAGKPSVQSALELECIRLSVSELGVHWSLELEPSSVSPEQDS